MSKNILSILTRVNTNWFESLARKLGSSLGTTLIVILTLFAYNAWAAPTHTPQIPPSQNAVPGLISYQGYLTEQAGKPVNGNTNIAFRLYSAPTGGTALWTEAYTGTNAISVKDGLFNAHLGSLIPIPSTVWDNGEPLYLGVQVDSDAEMSPRELVGAVPYVMSPPALNLDHGTVCLSGHATVELPGGYDESAVPGLTLDFAIDKPSLVLVWIDGLARFIQTSNGEASIALRVDGSTQTMSFVYDTDDVWFNVEGQRLVNLDSGSHSLQVFANSYHSGSMVVHGVGGYRTCINYLVLGEQ